MDTDESNQFVERLQFVLSFLSEHGFDKAATAVYEQLESKPEGVDELETGEPALQSTPEYAPEEEQRVQEYRSASAEPVLQGSLGATQAAAEDADESQHHHPWPPGAAEALQTRLSGSSRLYEDPDVDEYSSMDDVGYVRRSVSNQQEFIMSQLDFLRTNDDECYFHSGSLQHGGSSSLQRGDSCSNSSSASLSSPGLSSCAQQDQQEVSSAQQLQAQGRGSSSTVTGDAAWDSGPAGITFAEPVTTPTKDSQRNSISDLQPSLSRVESLSNSFIEEFESVDGGAGCAEGHSRQESEAGSVAGDLGTPPRRSRGDRSSSDAGAGASKQDRTSDPANDVIDLSPPSPPPDCAADAGIDLSNIFELGLRASSRTSSVDVLQGSVRCYSEPDLSEALFGQQQQLDTGRTWASYSAGTSGAGSNSSSRANSSLGMASLGGPGGLVIKPRQSAGASRLQSASQHDPEEVVLDLQPKQQPQQAQEPQQQQEQAQPQAAGAEQEQAGVSVEQQQDAQQQAQVDDSVLVLSPTHEQQPDACALTFSQQKDKQQQQQEQPQLRPQGGSSDSGSSSSTAGPVTPTALGTTIIAASSSDASAAAAADVAAAAAAVADVDGTCLKPPAAEASVADVEADPTAAAAAPAEGSASPASPPAAAAAAAGGAGGFGFTFPTTPPSAVDAAVHEERAERVFSTWASNHSRSLSGALDLEFAAAEDAEADTSSSRPPAESTSAAAGAAEAEEGATADSADPWGFPALAIPAADDPSTSGTAAAAAAAAGDAAATAACDAAATAAGRSSSPEGPGEITLIDPVSPVESPFLAGAALASCSKSSSPAGKALSRGGSRAHSSSSAAIRAAAAGNSSRSSSRRLSAAGRQQQQQQQQALTTSSGGARSPLGDGAQGPATSGVLGSGHLQQQGSAGYDALGNALIPGLDADAESTGDFSGSGELSAPRYVIDEAGNLLYEYDNAYIENRYETFELRIIHRRRRTGFEDSKEFPIRKNDLIAGRYQVMDFLGSAAFSQAVQALDVATGALVCLKIIKNNKDYFDQSLDEIKLLRYVNNADPDDEHHIVRLYDFFYYKEHLILVCELLRANLYEFQKYQRENGDEPYFTPPRIQRIAIQVLQSLAFLHSLGLVHSDLKPENILIKSYSRCEVKVIDLGSSCFITDHLSSYVQSRSYRAPEVILGLPYGQKIDIWSLGCILAELATGYVLFQNDSLATLLARLEGILGPLPSWMVAQGRYSNRYYTRSRQLYERSKSNGRYELLLPKHTSLRHRVPAADEGFLDFLSYLLTSDPTARPSATEALQHPWLSYPYPPVEQIPD